MNMCSVRHRPIPSAPNSRARRASSGVSAFARTPSRRTSSAQPSTVSKFGSTCGSVSGTSSAETRPVEPSIAIRSPSAQLHVAHPQHVPLEVDPQRRRAGHARLAHAARDQRGVRRLAALGGQDALGGEEAVHVVGLGERPHEDHLAPALRPVDRVVGREDDLALGRAGRRRDAAGEHLEVRVGREGRVQEGVQAGGVDRVERLLARQQPLGHRVDREAHGRLGGPLGVARLQHVERALLDRELRVLHVLVVRLERARGCRISSACASGIDVAHLGEVARRAHAGDDVLALRVDEEVARRLGRARHLVARERDARARRVALVAEHHLLDVAGGAPVVGDVVDPPVGDRALAQPRVEHRADRLAQLLRGSCGNSSPISSENMP